MPINQIGGALTGTVQPGKVLFADSFAGGTTTGNYIARGSNTSTTGTVSFTAQTTAAIVNLYWWCQAPGSAPATASASITVSGIGDQPSRQFDVFDTASISTVGQWPHQSGILPVVFTGLTPGTTYSLTITPLWTTSNTIYVEHVTVIAA